jgi:hypothetical protein
MIFDFRLMIEEQRNLELGGCGERKGIKCFFYRYLIYRKKFEKFLGLPLEKGIGPMYIQIISRL